MSRSSIRTPPWRAYVTSDMADVAFGMEAVRRILKILQGQEFYEAISRIPGYRVKDAGVIKTIGEVFRRSE
ncbi:hypothetical protein [Mesorhizobium sp. 2RAF21]|uniref:hypothetical protein n=1 Tax=Mesorhizobium sp. 2RAF21 TaxID=3232995 RepID=UPI003F9CF2AD